MITRIVKMQFAPNDVEAFLETLQEYIASIRGFPGCMGVDLLRDLHTPGVYITYSHWTTEKALDTYRHSELFAKVWSKVKVLFITKPEAWSLERIEP